MAIIKKTNKNKLLVRMWKKWSPHTLLAGMGNAAATLEKFGILKILM